MRASFWVGMLPVLLLSVGCGGAPGSDTVMGQALAGAPDWVMGCDNIYEGQGIICGVGSIMGTRNVAIARSSAQGRGRTAIARVLQTRVKALLKDYQSTTTGGAAFGEAANDEQHIEDVSKQITNISISGAKQKKFWVGPDGTLHVLMALNVEEFKDAVGKMKQLNEAVRAAVVERANKSFNELDAATAQ